MYKFQNMYLEGRIRINNIWQLIEYEIKYDSIVFTLITQWLMSSLINIGNTGWVAGDCRGEKWGLSVKKETLMSFGYDEWEYALDAVGRDTKMTFVLTPKTNVIHLTWPSAWGQF